MIGCVRWSVSVARSAVGERPCSTCRGWPGNWNAAFRSAGRMCNQSEPNASRVALLKYPHTEYPAMTEKKDEKKPEPASDVPAHSTPEEKERLKDFNKDGIPPGVC
ncbi:hypothetical protein ALP71_01924 [Pseudomonas coronafaciens pv. garcae]|nr:hypothetical protein ALP71_01924 [Pseudomonas coronafaciens pv. garcae]